MGRLRRLLYVLVQCTWGLLQTALGAAVFLRYAGQPHFLFHGAVATQYPLYSSLSLGLFIFVTDKPPGGEENSRRLLVHEYGHTVQSLILGPLYLPVVGLPSLLWAQLPACQRRWRTDMPYYSFYTEWTADLLGERVTREPSMRLTRL